MTVPTVVGIGADNTGTTGAVTYTLPTHQSGDILLLFCETNVTGGLTAPTGWAHITGSPWAHGSNTTTLNVFWKRAASGSETNPQVPASSNHQTGFAMSIRGCVAAGNPWDVISASAATGTATTSVSIPGVTTTVADCLVFVTMVNNTDTATDQFSSIADATLSSFTTQNQAFTADGNGGGVAVATGSKATAGGTGTATATIAASSSYAGVQFALQPATGSSVNGTATGTGAGTASAAGGVTHRGMTSAVVVTLPLQVAAGKVASNLTAFVIRRDVSDFPLEFWQYANTGNIRVKQAGVLVPVDVTRIDFATHTGELFWKASLLTASANDFTLEVTPGQSGLSTSDPNGRNAVWSDYAAIIVPSSGSITNRTGGTSPSLAGTTGLTLTANGLTFAASTSGEAKVTGLSTYTAWTMGCRARQNVNDGSNRAMLSYGTNNVTDANRATLLGRASSGQFGIWNSTDSYLLDPGSSTATELNVWHRWHHTQNGTTDRKIWRDGVLAATDTTCAQRPTGGDTWFLGNEDTTDAEYWRGDLDYAYLRNGVLSADWLAAENSSWHGAVAGFCTVGSPTVTPSSGAGTASASGLPTVVGTASGTGAGSASAVGVRKTFGTASGTQAGTGSAAGTRRATGTATGTEAGTASGVGVRTVLGTAAGTQAGSASAAGTHVVYGTASGTEAGTGSGAGVVSSPPVGSASGTQSGTASAVGTVTVYGLSIAAGTGTASAVGLVTRPGTASSSGAGTGTAVGIRTTFGTATGTQAGTALAVSAEFAGRYRRVPVDPSEPRLPIDDADTRVPVDPSEARTPSIA